MTLHILNHCIMVFELHTRREYNSFDYHSHAFVLGLTDLQIALTDGNGFILNEDYKTVQE